MNIPSTRTLACIYCMLLDLCVPSALFLAEHSGFQFVGLATAATVFLLLWFRLVRNTVDRLFHTTLITSSCVLIWAFLMSNHFNKNVISSGSWELKARENIFLLLFILLSSLVLCFLYLASRWFIKTQKATHAITVLSTRTLLSLFANREEKLEIIFDL